jgi:hypothetical protein
MLTRERFLSNIGQIVKKYCDAREREQAQRSKDWSTGVMPLIPYSGNLHRLLRLGRNAKRKEHGAKSKGRDFSLHVFPCFDPLVTRHLTLVTSHLIILSALTSTFGGIVRPICFAVLRLIISSSFIARSTGMSAGLAPFDNLSM